MHTIRAVAIDEAMYAPYGAVVRAGPSSAARSANYGTALAWDGLATIENQREGRARVTASLFRCLPQDASELAVRRLERHPRSTQMFVPMGAGRYLLIVARGGDGPDLATLAAFVVDGPAAITYAPGTWHHPIVALDQAIDFVNVVSADGTALDCEELPVLEAPVVRTT